MKHLHDEISGIEQLDLRRAWHERTPVRPVQYLFMFTIGALVTAIAFLFSI